MCLRIIIAAIKFLIHLREFDLVVSFPGVRMDHLPQLLVLRLNQHQILIDTVLRRPTLRRALQRHLTTIIRLMTAILGLPHTMTTTIIHTELIALIVHRNHSLHQLTIHFRLLHLLNNRDHIVRQSRGLPPNLTLHLNIDHCREPSQIPLHQLLTKDNVRHRLLLTLKRLHLRQCRLSINYLL